MGFYRSIIIFFVLVFGIYWTTFVAVDWIYELIIEESIQTFKRHEGHYPYKIKALEETKFNNRFGEYKPYMKNIPEPRWGYRWKYNKNTGNITRVGSNRLIELIGG